MRHFLLVYAAWSLVPAFLGASGSTLHGQEVAGRVADRGNRRPIAGAEVLMVGTRHVATTDTAGDFVLQDVPVGTYEILVQHPSYREIRDSLEVPEGGTRDLLVLLWPEPVPLEGIEVEGISAAERRRRASASGYHVALTRSVLEEYEHRGAVTVADLFWSHPRLTRLVRPMHGGLCIEYPRGRANRSVVELRKGGLGGCSFPATYVDGVYMGGDPLEVSLYLRDLPTTELQSVAFLPPREAAIRYGSQAGNGALVITTRRGAAEELLERALLERTGVHHRRFLWVGATAGVVGGFGFALLRRGFSKRATFEADLYPFLGILAAGVGMGEVLYRLLGKDP